MKYFKNTELAKIHHVSEKTVRNWISSTKDRKLGLEIITDSGRSYIANTRKNNQIVEKLVTKGKKYKNSRGFKAITPSDDFYTLYSQKEVLDIISSLSTHKEIPLQYGYIDGGAESWDNYSKRLVQEQTPNVLTRTINLLDQCSNYIDSLIGSKRKVNIIDLGPGNGLPVRGFLKSILKSGRLNRYIAIDISQDMLNILDKNINDWFDGQIKVEGYVRDFKQEHFADLIVSDYCEGEENAPVNLVCFLGGTLANFRHPDYVLQTISNNLRLNDLLIYTGYLDTSYTRRYFDLSGSTINDKNDTEPSNLIAHLLNVDKFCDIKQNFDKEKAYRCKTMEPNVDLRIDFKLGGHPWSVELAKGEKVLLWRHNHYSIQDLIELLSNNGLDLLQATKSKDQNYAMLISKLKS